MRKLILTTTSAILTILLVSIIYLSNYGIKTDNFNSFIYLTLSAKLILSIYNSMLGEVNACFNSKSNSSECFNR